VRKRKNRWLYLTMKTLIEYQIKLYFKRGCSFRSREEGTYVRESNVGCQKFLIDANSARRATHTQRVTREIYDRVRSTKRGLTVDWLSKMGLARESRAISRVYLCAPVINGPFLVERESILHIRNICTHIIHTRARIIVCIVHTL